ncbi:MAG: hypothetical protein IH905_13110 [Proteobacteria bacterium]|nr:hypothetical protein [Pseudomonadota bacterium]
MVQIFLEDRAYDCGPGENVLDALLRQDVALSFSVRRGSASPVLGENGII